jgi:hypothetical protein
MSTRAWPALHDGLQVFADHSLLVGSQDEAHGALSLRIYLAVFKYRTSDRSWGPSPLRNLHSY